MESGQLVLYDESGAPSNRLRLLCLLDLATLAGLLAGVLARGTVNPAGEEGWFSFLGQTDGFNRSALPLMGALTVSIFAFVGSIWHFNSVDVIDQLGITTENGYHGYAGYWSALLTSVVAFIVAGMGSRTLVHPCNARWLMWTLYQVAAWFEAGIWYNEDLDGTWGALIWLAITFFLCVWNLLHWQP